MKRIALLSALLLVAVWPQGFSVAAQPSQERAAEIVAALAAEFRAMKSYEVGFEVEAGEYRVSGSYAVAGENYCLVLGDAEVYADAGTRYEVDNRRKEVTVSVTESASRNILNNPVHAFDFLGSEYASSLLWERGGEAAVLLKPVPGSGASTGDITLVVATQGMRPRSVNYEFDGDRIVVRILRVEPLRHALAVFDRAAHADYEWIDFR